MISSERTSQEEQNDTNFSLIAPFSEEYKCHKTDHTSYLGVHILPSVDASVSVDKGGSARLSAELVVHHTLATVEQVVVDRLPQFAQPQALGCTGLGIDRVGTLWSVHLNGILVA